MLSPLLPLQALEIRSLSPASRGQPGATLAPACSSWCSAYPPPSERQWRRGSGLHKGPSPLAARVGNPPAPGTNLAFPHLLLGALKTRGSVGVGGVRRHHCSWEPTFPGYLPDLVSPNTQFIFFSSAASFLFSAAFGGQGSPGSRQRLSPGRNSFETWLLNTSTKNGPKARSGFRRSTKRKT